VLDSMLYETLKWPQIAPFCISSKKKFRPGGGGGQPGPMINKQVENCFLNHNSSIHFCCTDSLLMTHRGELVWVSLFGELEEGGQVSFYPGIQKFSWRPWRVVNIFKHVTHIYIYKYRTDLFAFSAIICIKSWQLTSWNYFTSLERK
jgi:hypothetical protein